MAVLRRDRSGRITNRDPRTGRISDRFDSSRRVSERDLTTDYRAPDYRSVFTPAVRADTTSFRDNSPSDRRSSVTVVDPLSVARDHFSMRVSGDAARPRETAEEPSALDAARQPRPAVGFTPSLSTSIDPLSDPSDHDNVLRGLLGDSIGSGTMLAAAREAGRPDEGFTSYLDPSPERLAYSFGHPVPKHYGGTIIKAGERHDVDPRLLAGLMQQETGYLGTPERAARAVSPKGAVGLMQFMPDTAKRFGIDPLDPEEAIDGAARYLREHLDEFGDPDLAAAAYNAGEGAVRKYGGIPPFRETRGYVRGVREHMAAMDAYPMPARPRPKPEITDPLVAGITASGRVVASEPVTPEPGPIIGLTAFDEAIKGDALADPLDSIADAGLPAAMESLGNPLGTYGHSAEEPSRPVRYATIDPSPVIVGGPYTDPRNPSNTDAAVLDAIRHSAPEEPLFREGIEVPDPHAAPERDIRYLGPVGTAEDTDVPPTAAGLPAPNATPSPERMELPIAPGLGLREMPMGDFNAPPTVLPRPRLPTAPGLGLRDVPMGDFDAGPTETPDLPGLVGLDVTDLPQFEGLDPLAKADAPADRMPEPPLAKPAPPPPMVRRGDRGTHVEAMQRQLRDQGYDIAVDGVFGSETERALREFQGETGIASDAIVGPDTRRRLGSTVLTMGFDPLGEMETVDNFTPEPEGIEQPAGLQAGLSGAVEEMEQAAARAPTPENIANLEAAKGNLRRFLGIIGALGASTISDPLSAEDQFSMRVSGDASLPADGDPLPMPQPPGGATILRQRAEEEGVLSPAADALDFLGIGDDEPPAASVATEVTDLPGLEPMSKPEPASPVPTTVASADPIMVTGPGTALVKRAPDVGFSQEAGFESGLGLFGAPTAPTDEEAPLPTHQEMRTQQAAAVAISRATGATRETVDRTIADAVRQFNDKVGGRITIAEAIDAVAKGETGTVGAGLFTGNWRGAAAEGIRERLGITREQGMQMLAQAESDLDSRAKEITVTRPQRPDETGAAPARPPADETMPDMLEEPATSKGAAPPGAITDPLEAEQAEESMSEVVSLDRAFPRRGGGGGHSSGGTRRAPFPERTRQPAAEAKEDEVSAAKKEKAAERAWLNERREYWEDYLFGLAPMNLRIVGQEKKLERWIDAQADKRIATEYRKKFGRKLAA